MGHHRYRFAHVVLAAALALVVWVKENPPQWAGLSLLFWPDE